MDEKKERKPVDRQFKLDAGNLVAQGGGTVQEIARNLGMAPKTGCAATPPSVTNHRSHRTTQSGVPTER